MNDQWKAQMESTNIEWRKDWNDRGNLTVANHRCYTPAVGVTRTRILINGQTITRFISL